MNFNIKSAPKRLWEVLELNHFKEKVEDGLLRAYLNVNNNIDKIASLAIATLATIFIPMPVMAKALDGLLSNFGGIAITIIAIVGIVSIVKLSADNAKGQGSSKSVIVAVLVTLILIGIIVVLMNVEQLQQIFGGVANKAVKTTGDVASEALS